VQNAKADDPVGGKLGSINEPPNGGFVHQLMSGHIDISISSNASSETGGARVFEIHSVLLKLARW
jgi:hypothetical protein